MAEIVTLKRVYHDEAKTKFGDKVRTSIYTVEYPETKMSYLGNYPLKWKEGDQVSVEITKKGDFTNFKPADTKTVGGVATDQLEKRVKRIEDHLWPKDNEIVASDDTNDDW